MNELPKQKLDSVRTFVYERLCMLKGAKNYLEAKEPDYDFKTLDTTIGELEAVLKVIDWQVL
jgi:hypothetical protein